MSEREKESAEHQRIVNAETIKALRERGDNPRIVRPVQHWIYPAANPISDELRRRIRELGFAEVAHDEKGLIIEADSTTTSDDLDRTAITLAWLCEEFGCDYDGWETEVTDSDS